MATYYDGLNDFHKLIELKRPPSSAQLLGLHLLHLNNRNGNSGSVQISDRELIFRTNLSKQTVTEAKRYLKNIGWLDFSTDKHKGTTYTLTFFSEEVGHQLGHKVGHQLGHKAGHSSLVSYTLKPEEEKDRDDDASAKGRKSVAKATAANPDAYAQAKPLSSPIPQAPDANQIHKEWVKAFGFELRGDWALKLEEFASLDYAKTVTAIQRTKASNPANPFPYFKRVCENVSPQEEKPKVKEKTVSEMFSSLTKLEENIGSDKNDDE